MPITNNHHHSIHRKRDKPLGVPELIAIALAAGTLLIIYFEATTQVEQVYFIGGLYVLLTLGSWLYSRGRKKPG